MGIIHFTKLTSFSTISVILSTKIRTLLSQKFLLSKKAEEKEVTFSQYEQPLARQQLQWLFYLNHDLRDRHDSAFYLQPSSHAGQTHVANTVVSAIHLHQSWKITKFCWSLRKTRTIIITTTCIFCSKGNQTLYNKSNIFSFCYLKSVYKAQTIAKVSCKIGSVQEQIETIFSIKTREI